MHVASRGCMWHVAWQLWRWGDVRRAAEVGPLLGNAALQGGRVGPCGDITATEGQEN